MKFYENPFIPKPVLTWKAREVMKDLNDSPHLLLLIEVKGRYFPHRAMDAAGRIGNASDKVLSLFGSISDDNQTMKIYFPADTPDGMIEVGYDDGYYEVIGELHRKKIALLDRERIPKNTIFFNRDYHRKG